MTFMERLLTALCLAILGLFVLVGVATFFAG